LIDFPFPVEGAKFFVVHLDFISLIAGKS
jgi:hypothetical protein